MTPCFTVLDHAVFTEQKMAHFCHFLASFKRYPLTCGETKPQSSAIRDGIIGTVGWVYSRLPYNFTQTVPGTLFQLVTGTWLQNVRSTPDASSPRIHRNAVQFTASLGVPSTSLCPSCHHARPSVACLLMQSPSPPLAPAAHSSLRFHALALLCRRLHRDLVAFGARRSPRLQLRCSVMAGKRDYQQEL